MAEPETVLFLLILLAAFAAGFVDSVAGGGGLITMPTLLLAFPGAPVAAILATTKCASFAGTTGAAISYGRKVALPWPILLPAMFAALPASWLGARAVTYLDPEMVKPIILGVLMLLALYTWYRPNLGDHPTPGITRRLHGLGGYVLGATLGFYDGFLGPGTGSILVMILITVFGRDFLQATAATKFINCASNVGSLVYFAAAGMVVWRLALPMAACNLAGGLLGSRMAMASGNAWIRRVFLCVVWALIARLAWNLYGPDFS